MLSRRTDHRHLPDFFLSAATCAPSFRHVRRDTTAGHAGANRCRGVTHAIESPCCCGRSRGRRGLRPAACVCGGALRSRSRPDPNCGGLAAGGGGPSAAPPLAPLASPSSLRPLRACAPLLRAPLGLGHLALLSVRAPPRLLSPTPSRITDNKRSRGPAATAFFFPAPLPLPTALLPHCPTASTAPSPSRRPAPWPRRR